MIHLELIMKLLQTWFFFFTKLSKCNFATSKVSYLGHIISQAGVAPDFKSIPRSHRILYLPDFTQPFAIDTDASVVAVGVVLNQASHLIVFFSKKDVSPSPSSINVCERDVCNHKSNQKIASILVRKPFKNLHRSKEPQYTAITNNPDTRTTKMDNKTSRV